MSHMIRVAAAQFHIGDDVAANLRTCLRILDNARYVRPQLLVLPEFCNHCSWYHGPDHCLEVAVELDGDFLSAVAEAVRALGAWTVINCSLRREQQVTGSSLLFSPTGEIVAIADKQVLIGHENDFLTPASGSSPVVDTPLTTIGMYACMDGVISETPRCLALQGARVLCNSLNSMALDEGTLHIPVRAAENRVWVIAANKIGPLIPESALDAASKAIHIPARFLVGAGDSQIVSPDGTVVAHAGKKETVISADIAPTIADIKLRMDHTHIFATRRPALYAPLAQDPATEAGACAAVSGPERVLAAVICLDEQGDAAVDQACTAIGEARARAAELICLPALPGKTGVQDVRQSPAIIERFAEAAGEHCLIATSLALPLGDAGDAAAANADLPVTHAAVLISGDGLLLQQPLVHAIARYSWAANGDGFVTVDTPRHGRLAVVCSDDLIYPETCRLLALQGVSTVLVPADFLEPWEAEIGLVERAAENRVNIVAASHRCSKSRGLICSLQRDFTITRPWQDREFDGLLTAPEVVRADELVTLAEVHPQAAANKVCSPGTHLLDSRPWQLLQPMMAEAAADQKV